MSKLIVIAFAFFTFSAKAQDPEFTQTMATPSYFNPAFAGIQQNLRAGLQFRDQWPGISGSVITAGAGADMGIGSTNSSVGLMLMHDQRGDNNLTANTVNAYYCYEIKLEERSYLRLGFNPSFSQQSVDLTNLRFSDQVDPKLGFIYQSEENLSPGKYMTGIIPDLAIGALYYNSKFYGGLAIYNILQPRVTFFKKGGTPIDRRFTVQAGYFWSWGKFIINPYILEMSQGTYYQVLPGVNATRGMWTLGAAFRQTNPNGDAVNFLFGFAKGVIKVCYSYDLTISHPIPGAGGSHELSLVVQLNKRHDTSAKPMIEHLRKSF